MMTARHAPPIKRQKSKPVPGTARPDWGPVMDALTDAICLVDGKKNILHANRAMLKLLGRRAGQVIGENLEALLPEIKQVPSQRQPGNGKGSPSRQPAEILHCDRWLEVNADAWPVSGDRPAGCVYLFRDVTFRKTAEKALRDSESHYRKLAETVHDMIFIVDRNGAIEYVNGYAARQFNRPAGKIAGKQLAEILPAGVTAPLSTELEKVFAKKKPIYVEGEVTFPKRKVHLGTWLVPLKDESGEVPSVLGLGRDITARRKTEEKLRETEAKYRALVEKIPAAVYVDALDEEKPVIYYISPEIERITGYPPKQWIENPQLWLKIIHPDDRQKFIKDNRRTNATGAPFSSEYRVLARDGRVVWVQDEAILLYDNEKKPKYWQGIILDITERKLVEEKQRAMIERISSHEHAIAYLAAQGLQAGDDFETLARTINEKACDATGVEQAGIWLLERERGELRCVDLYEQKFRRHSPGPVLEVDKYPQFFQALEADRAIDAHTARKDPRTRRLSRAYLTPFGVTSLLSSAIRVSGEVVGLVSLEQVTVPRRWSFDELTFVGEVADQAARIFMNVERRQTEIALHESRQMLRSVLDTIPVRVFWKDSDSNYLGCNQPFAADAGLASPQDILGKNDYQMGWKEQADLYRVDDHKVITSGRPRMNYEEPQTTPRGDQIWLRTSKVPLLDANGKVRGVLGTYEDITESKLIERALRESEEKLRNIIEQASEGFVLIDEDGRVTEWNQAVAEIWGRDREFALGKPFWDLLALAAPPERMSPDRIVTFRTAVLEAVRTGKSPLFNRPIDGVVVRPNGERRSIEQTIFPVKTFQGFRIGSLTRDITSHKQADEALQRQLKELTILHEVALAGTQAESVDDLIERMTEIIGRSFYPDNFGVMVLDQERQYLQSHASYRLGKVKKKSVPSFPLGEGVTSLVLTTGQPHRVADVSTEPRYIGVTNGIRSELCVPILVSGAPFGVINAESKELDFFSPEDERLLGTIAVQLGIAIEKLRLLEAEQIRRQEAETLRQAAAAVSSSLEVRQVLDTILISLKQVVPYDSASVMLREDDSLRLMAIQGAPKSEAVTNQVFPVEDELFGESLLTRKPIILADAQRDPRFKKWGESDYVRGWMGVPLIYRDSVVGYVTLDSRKPSAYNDESAKLALTFAQQAAIAIENARLYEQAVKATERWQILHQASQEIARASQDPEGVYLAVERAAGRLMPAEAFVIALVDESTQQTIPVYLVDKGDRWNMNQIPPGQGLSGRVIASGESVIIPDLAETPDPNLLSFGDEEDVRSILAVPMRLGEKVIGMLSTQSYQPCAYTVQDQVFLEMLAAHAAVAIGNARLYAETRHRLTELEAVSRISTVLRTAQTVQDMLPLLMEETLRAVESDTGAILLYDPASGMLKRVISRGWFAELGRDPLAPGEGIAGTVFNSNQAIITSDFSSDERNQAGVRGLIPPGWSGACIPIRTVQETLGVMFVALRQPRQLQPEELHLLGTISEMAGNAIRRADLHQQTERQVQRLASLRAIDTAISTILDLRVTLGVLLDHISSQLKVDAVDVLLLNSNTQTLEHAASTGFHTDSIQRAHLYIGEGLAGQAIRSRGLVYIPNLMVSNPHLRRQLLTDEGFVTYFGIPLIAKGQIKGVLEVYNRTPKELDPEWRGFFETLAGETAIAIENATLFEELQHTNLDLSLAYDATIEGWSKALDLRDRETEGHTQRVTEKTLQLAREMGIGDMDLVHIRRGALLHDIGKMGVPDSILYKPGKLDETEWDIMRRHPAQAFDMLSPISYLRHALDIPYCHHENWSGTGYPRGLKGEQIPLSARIFAVVDVWDALTSDRPYRKAWTRKDALDYIEKNGGLLFDPKVTEVFLKMVERD